MEELPTQESLCTSTGGDWGPHCSPSICGVESLLDCLDMACNCPGEFQVWDSVFGCVDGEQCYRAEEGDRCDRGARCAPELVCCDCVNDECDVPVCAQPSCLWPGDVCGNTVDF